MLMIRILLRVSYVVELIGKGTYAVYARQCRKSRPQFSRMLDEFGLTRLRNNRAYSLSGGERRRLEIARALCSDPEIILLDEPFTGIDPIAVGELQELVVGLKDRGIGVLITDHNVLEALRIIDRACILSEGHIVTHGTAGQLLEDPIAREHYLGDRIQASHVGLERDVPPPEPGPVPPPRHQWQKQQRAQGFGNPLPVVYYLQLDDAALAGLQQGM